MLLLILIILGYTLIMSITAISVLFHDEILSTRERIWPELNIIICSIIFSAGFIVGSVRRKRGGDD